MMVLVTNSLLKNQVSAQITTGRVIKLERFSLYNEYFSIDTLWSFYMSNEDLKEIKLFYRKENGNNDKKNEDIKIQYKNNNLFFVYIGDELFKIKGIEKTKFSISSNTFKITKIEVISKIDSEYDFTLFVLDGYGLLITSVRKIFSRNSSSFNNFPLSVLITCCYFGV
jgi:hypothetical protein